MLSVQLKPRIVKRDSTWVPGQGPPLGVDPKRIRKLYESTRAQTPAQAESAIIIPRILLSHAAREEVTTMNARIKAPHSPWVRRRVDGMKALQFMHLRHAAVTERAIAGVTGHTPKCVERMFTRDPIRTSVPATTTAEKRLEREAETATLDVADGTPEKDESKKLDIQL